MGRHPPKNLMGWPSSQHYGVWSSKAKLGPAAVSTASAYPTAQWSVNYLWNPLLDNRQLARSKIHYPDSLVGLFATNGMTCHHQRAIILTVNMITFAIFVQRAQQRGAWTIRPCTAHIEVLITNQHLIHYVGNSPVFVIPSNALTLGEGQIDSNC